MADADKSNKAAPLPWVLLTGLLGVFAVGVPQTGTPNANKDAKKDGEQVVRIAPDDPLKPVFDFHKSHDNTMEPEDELRERIHGYQTEFVIATVPDPIDSAYGYAFDQVVDAIQRGIEKKNGYILDRSWLPWELDRKAKAVPPPPVAPPTNIFIGEPQGPFRNASLPRETTPPTPAIEDTKKRVRTPGTPGLLRETRPGIMLFRHGRDRTRGVTAPGLCVVFLVGETPTSGIHKQAFHYALRLMRDVGHSEDTPVRVIGPYFSGSQTSLQFAIGDWWKLGASFYYIKDPYPAYKFNIITGNATSVRKTDFFGYEANKDTFHAWPKDGINFSSTVIPTRLTLSAMLNYLTERDGSNTQEAISSEIKHVPGKVAILAESNTGFGKAIANMNRDEIVTLRFPLHISRVKSEYNSAARKKDEQSGLVEKDPLLALSVTDDQGPSEGVPSQGGSTTTATNGQVLSRILATIARERCRYVGVIASDTRDKLFLIRLIREYCPDVCVFVTDGDLLLTHPDYRYYMRGVLIGSTYPLVPRNQNWVKANSNERILFPTVGAQGYYNATLMHFGVTEQLLEYAAPGFALRGLADTTDAEQRPPIWISMVAPNGSIVPLHLYTKYEDKAYVARREQPQEGEHTIADLNYPGALLPIALVLLAGWGFLIYQAWGNPYARLFWKGGSMLKLSDLFYRNVILGSQVLLIVPIVGAVWTHAEAKGFGHWWSLALVGVGVFCALALALGMVKPLLRRHIGHVLRGHPLPSDSGVMRNRVPDSRAETIAWLVLNSGILLMVYSFATLFIIRFETQGDFARRTLFFIRAVDLTTGLSPLTPLFFVCAAYAAWGFFQLKRSHIAERYNVSNPYPNTSNFMRIHDADRAVRDEVSEESIAVKHFGAIAGAIVAIMGFGIAVWLQSLPTAEGWAWDLLFFTGFAGLFVLSSTNLVRLFFLWRRLKGLLDAIGSQPMMRAFSRLPLKITDVFGKYLFTQKPQLDHLQIPAHQLRLLCDEVSKDSTAPESLRNLGTTADEIDSLLAQHLLRGTKRGAIRRAERDVREKLNNVAALCVGALAPRGQWLPVDDAFGAGQGKEAKFADWKDPAWVALAESVAATQVVIYLSQFFVQLRNLVWSAITTASLLLMAATSYPFHPEKLLLMGLITLSAGGIAGVLYLLIEMNRDELVSRVTKTIPGKFSLDSGFLGSFFTYIVPTVGVLAAQLSGSFRWILEPLLRVMK